MITCIALICGQKNGVEGLISIVSQLRMQTYKDIEIMPIACCLPYVNEIQGLLGVNIVVVPHSGTYDKDNLGIEMAQRKYLGFFAGDDIYLPTYIEQMLGKAETEEAGVVYCNFLSHYRQDGTVCPGAIEMGHVTNGSFIIRTDLAKQSRVPITQTGDIEYLQQIMTLNPKTAHVDEMLYIHR